MCSAYEHPNVMDAYLTREAHLQRIILLDNPTFLALVGSFYLIYWPDEDSVTFVPSSSVLEQQREVKKLLWSISVQIVSCLSFCCCF